LSILHQSTGQLCIHLALRISGSGDR
jgi:hypothetical protein